MRIIKTTDYEDMSRKAALVIASQLISKPDSLLGLATGSTPIGTYKELVAMYNKGDLDFSRARSVNLDEYVGLPRENDQSYYYFMHDNLFDHVNIAPEATNLPNGMAKDIDAECVRYDALIASLGGIDLQLLGLGHDGHVGFNEPSDHFSIGTNHVKLTEMTIEANKRFFASADEVPRYAVTMGMREIMQAKKVLVVVSGKDKAEILYKVCFGPVTPQVPGSILRLHKDCIIVADEEALSVCVEHGVV